MNIDPKLLVAGDYVRSWDFEPMEDRPDRYIEGRIIEFDAGCLSIAVEKDTVFNKGDRTVVRTPIHFIGGGEWNGRIELLLDEAFWATVTTELEDLR